MLMRTLRGLFRSHESTSEHANDPALKTRYYSLPKETVWEEAKNVIKKLPGYEITHEIDRIGEMSVKKRTVTGRVQYITITILAITPVKTSVDIHSASWGIWGDLGANYRTIKQLYVLMDQRLKSNL